MLSMSEKDIEQRKLISESELDERDSKRPVNYILDRKSNQTKEFNFGAENILLNNRKR